MFLHSKNSFLLLKLILTTEIHSFLLNLIFTTESHCYYWNLLLNRIFYYWNLLLNQIFTTETHSYYWIYFFSLLKLILTSEYDCFYYRNSFLLLKLILTTEYNFYFRSELHTISMMNVCCISRIFHFIFSDSGQTWLSEAVLTRTVDMFLRSKNYFPLEIFCFVRSATVSFFQAVTLIKTQWSNM